MSVHRMLVVAGPPGGGKSSLFPLSNFSDSRFNCDDRAAQLNSGSYHNIPLAVRVIVNREFEAFVQSNIRARTDFALETTVRSKITFEQAKLAKENGFQVSMRYVALETVEQHIERVVRRAARGWALRQRDNAAKNSHQQLGEFAVGVAPGPERD